MSLHSSSTASAHVPFEKAPIQQSPVDLDALLKNAMDTLYSKYGQDATSLIKRDIHSNLNALHSAVCGIKDTAKKQHLVGDEELHAAQSALQRQAMQRHNELLQWREHELVSIYTTFQVHLVSF